MPEARSERRLAAILAADVAEYSRLMGVDEEGTLAVLKAHRRELIDPLLAQHHGRIFKTTGDGLLIEFASVIDAVRCAVVIQQGMEERNVSVAQSGRILFRIGINLGDIIVEEGDIFGDGVNVAARLETLAQPGEIYVSASVREQVGEKLPIGFADMGEHNVKNIARPIHVYKIERRVDPGADLHAFGPFVLDTRRGKLLREGRPVSVRSKGLRLLEVFLASSGRVLTKTELMHAAWADAAIEESNLSVQIAALRKQLGPTPDGSEWIATVPRVGYCFVGLPAHGLVEARDTSKMSLSPKISLQP